MKMPKPTIEDVAFFESVVAELPEVELKPMFGNLAGFVNGNMFCGLFGSDLGVRLDEAARSELLLLPGALPFGPPERPMKEYVTLPAQWRAEGADDQIRAWLRRALDHTAARPPKTKAKSPKKAAPK